MFKMQNSRNLRSRTMVQLAQMTSESPENLQEETNTVEAILDDNLTSHHTIIAQPSTSKNCFSSHSDHQNDSEVSPQILDLITPEDIGIDTGKKDEIEEDSRSFLDSDRSVFDDSCADPDYISDTDSSQQRGRKTFTFNKHNNILSTESESSIEEAIPTVIEKPKRRKIVTKRCILTEIEKVKRNKEKYPILPVSCKCLSVNPKNKCHTIDEDKRMVIWDNFWNCNYITRRQWLSKCVSTKSVQRITTTANRNRTVTRVYFIEDPQTKDMMKVCKSFFFKTLGYSSDAVITSLFKAKALSPCDGGVKENRGQYKRRVLQTDKIIMHINSYHPCQSHYRRHNAPYVKYLPHGLTLRGMYQNYVEKYPEFHHSKEIYRQVMKTMNVSLHTPKSDMCGDCEIFKHKYKKYVLTLKELASHAVHKLKAKCATELYRQDVVKAADRSDTKVVAVDLQKVFLIPMMPGLKDSVFLSRLVSFNLTFAPLKKGEKATCLLWHEEISEREARNIIDAFYKFIKKQRDIKNFVFWADNCTAQNKNWFLFTAFVQIVNMPQSGIETITIKYLTKGHTHNAADSVHGNIERALMKARNVYDFDDLKDVVLSSRRKMKILEIDPSEDKFNWAKKKRQATKSQDPLQNFLISSVTSVQFRKGSRTMFYQTMQQTEYNELDFLQKRFDITKLPERVAMRRGINPTKIGAIIQKLVPHMPENRRFFWRNLQTSNGSPDLVTRPFTEDND